MSLYVYGLPGTLTATVSPADAADKDILWSTSDATIADVNSSGVVSVVKAGTATITATCVANPSKAASCEVTGVPTLVEMVRVEDGAFQMGSIAGLPEDQPVHTVTVSSFLIGRYEVTQEQYSAIFGVNPSFFTGVANRPVEQITWYDAARLCNALSVREGLEKVYTVVGTVVTADLLRNGYRLPTEAEWEYAARGGKFSMDFRYSGSDNVDLVAWNYANAGGTTHPVGGKAANELGLFDMSGNVSEWCYDWFGAYASADQTDPAGPAEGTHRVLRGSSQAVQMPSFCAVFIRQYTYPDYFFADAGLRVARLAP